MADGTNSSVIAPTFGLKVAYIEIFKEFIKEW